MSTPEITARHDRDCAKHPDRSWSLSDCRPFTCTCGADAGFTAAQEQRIRQVVSEMTYDLRDNDG